MPKSIVLYIDEADVIILEEIILSFKDEIEFFVPDDAEKIPQDRLPIIIHPSFVEDMNSEKSLFLFQKWGHKVRFMQYVFFHKNSGGTIGRNEMIGASSKIINIKIETGLENIIPLSWIGWDANYWKAIGREASSETEKLWKNLKKKIIQNTTLVICDNGRKVYAFNNAYTKILNGSTHSDNP
ncbi:hypothetical protein KBB25_03490 [Candidatus Gracilibacteria bacterium]|nr:hypothetical protein [Candidatus Gracilibacteria bacterium]